MSGCLGRLPETASERLETFESAPHTGKQPARCLSVASHVGARRSSLWAQLQRVDDQHVQPYTGRQRIETRPGHQAPLAQQLLGKRVGDTAEFNHSGIVGTFELIELRNALIE